MDGKGCTAVKAEPSDAPSRLTQVVWSYTPFEIYYVQISLRKRQGFSHISKQQPGAFRDAWDCSTFLPPEVEPCFIVMERKDGNDEDDL